MSNMYMAEQGIYYVNDSGLKIKEENLKSVAVDKEIFKTMEKNKEFCIKKLNYYHS